MSDAQVTITGQLDAAKDLISRRRLDIESTLTMLNAMPDDFGEAARSSVERALQTVAAAARDSRYEALARFALARVVVMLEKQLAERVTAEHRTLSSDAYSLVESDAVQPAHDLKTAEGQVGSEGLAGALQGHRRRPAAT